LLADLTRRQFLDWQTLYSLEPFGQARDDMRMARIVWALLQPHSKKKLDESKFVFNWNYAKYATDAPKDGHEHRLKAMRVWANAHEHGLKLKGVEDERHDEQQRGN
jgi:hypothetical protein